MRVVRGLKGLRELVSLWDSIVTPRASPMQSYEWVRAWAELYGVDRDLEVFVSQDGESVAIAPMYRSKRGGRRLELAGPAELGEVMDILCSTPDAVPDLASAIVRSRLPVRFWRVPADSPIVPALLRGYRHRAFVRSRPASGCPSLALDASWTDPESHLDNHRRSNVRRARRIAEAIGPVSFEILSPGPEDVGRVLDEAYAVEAAGWKRHQGSPLALDASVGEFFRKYGTAAAARGVLRVCFLRIGGKATAMKLAAIAGGCFWLLAMGYDDSFERASPGTLLLIETIRYAARSGLRSYEFLGADEPWVRAWTESQRPCVSIRSYPPGLLGTVALASDGVAMVHDRMRRIRPMARRFPAALEQRLAGAYVAGPLLEDAVSASRTLHARGYRSVLSYMSEDRDPPEAIARQYAGTVDAIGTGGIDAHASVKAPLLRFSRDLFRGLAERARRHHIELHFDALAPGDVEETWNLIRDLHAVHDALGCTLPGRWRRSLDDADRAIDLDLGIRIVKGEWPDRAGENPDPRDGCLAIVDRIAGRARRAAIATHDPILAREALRRLRSKGTPCELEVLLGYPVQRVLRAAKAERVPVRIYIPYGRLSLPYSLRHLDQDPRIAGWALRDLFRGGQSTHPTIG